MKPVSYIHIALVGLCSLLVSPTQGDNLLSLLIAEVWGKSHRSCRSHAILRRKQ